MKVLMFGWEFPPFNSGGLGTACYGLTKGLKKNNVSVTFVVPHADCSEKSHVKLVSLSGTVEEKVKTLSVDSPMFEYVNPKSYTKRIRSLMRSNGQRPANYGKNLFEEVIKYAHKARSISLGEDFDVIHAHDWLTYKAGIYAKQASGKPLVVHVHATEFDRTGGHVNQAIYDIEREGMHAADHVIAVSQYTKNRIVQHYGIDADKVSVVHNGVEFDSAEGIKEQKEKWKGCKTVLFLGRLTIQKGPEYFLYAAKAALDFDDSIRFIIAGSGDMEPFLIEEASRLGIADKVYFTGFLRGADIDCAYRMADLYIMPSVSEPFGITPLEAMRNGTPVIISKQSGVSEVIKNCFKVDFWDIEEMVNKMIGCLHSKELHSTIQEQARAELCNFNWDDAAQKCVSVYEKMLRGG